MSTDRPAIPAELRRAVLVEAGHRCAIPTCRQYPVEIDHIVDWAKVRSHEFENLIALCPTCHTRKTSGEIDAKSIRQYKINLGVMTKRYTDLELQLLQWISDYQVGGGRPMVPEGMVWSVGNLVRDGIISLNRDGSRDGSGTEQSPRRRLLQEQAGQMRAQYVALTDKGRDLVRRWFNAQPL